MEPPSQKTKEAIEKLIKIPSVVRKNLDQMSGAAKARLQEALEPKRPARVQTDSITMPMKTPQQPKMPRYSPRSKRDPFRPWTLKTKVSRRPRESLSPLERYELGQLKLVGIVWDIKEPRAMVEDGAGLGYIIKIGTPIGTNEGKVKTIRPNEVVIEERYADFYGDTKTREVKIKLAREQEMR